MVLSDKTIRRLIETGVIKLDPYDPTMVQPASIDIRLGNRFLYFAEHERLIDVTNPDTYAMKEVSDNAFVLFSGGFVLGTTLEHIEIPGNIVCRLEGKSSLGRLGLIIHATAGFVDPGFNGNLTLEISNISPKPISLFAGMKIGQLSFMMMDQEVEKPYGSPELNSRYQNQQGPVGSKYTEKKNVR